MQTKFLYKSSAPGSVTVLWREEKPLKNQRKLTYSYVNGFSGTSSFSIEMAIRYSREVTLENDFILIWWEKK